MKKLYGIFILLLLWGCSNSSTNEAPVLGNPGKQTASVNTPISVEIMVTDFDSNNEDLNVSVSASDETVVASTTVEGAGSLHTVRVTPQPDQAGTASITLTATDDRNNTSSQTFEVEFTRLDYATFVRDVFARPANGEPQSLAILDPALDPLENFDDLLQ